MKRMGVVLLVSLSVFLLSVTGAVAATVGPENGSFEMAEEPRVAYQGWENEYIFGWKPFAGASWNNADKKHVEVVECSDAVGAHCLKLVGVEGAYVGIRSAHIPVKKMAQYTVTGKALVKELADPSRLQIWLEFWPENPKGETATYRLKYSRATAETIGEWQHLEVSDLAPADAATVTVLIIIHRSGKEPLLPAEAYVDDIRIEEIL